MTKIFIYIHFHLCIYSILAANNNYIENFTEFSNISDWQEHSDSVQPVGKSKASFVLLQTSKFQRALLFTLLNPQPCGAAFAGVRKGTKLNLSPYNSIILNAKGQGSYNGYKFILNDNKHNYSFCHFFEVSDTFREITLSLKKFKPYHEGKLIDKSDVHFESSHVTSIGIQAYGGAYLPIKQSGVAALEIQWIKYE